MSEYSRKSFITEMMTISLLKLRIYPLILNRHKLMIKKVTAWVNRNCKIVREKGLKQDAVFRLRLRELRERPER